MRMRLLLAAMTSGLVWVAVVGAAPVSVSIAASPAAVVYGGKSTLSGTVSDQKAGTKVTIQQQACGATSFKAATTVQTAAGGTWSTTAAPAMRTVYQARAKGGESSPLTVQVRPRMTLAKIAPHRFRVRVYAAQSFAGRSAVFLRFRNLTRRWVRVRTVVLKQITTAGPTVVSGKTFRSRIRRHRIALVRLPQSQAGACYLAGSSNAIST